MTAPIGGLPVVGERKPTPFDISGVQDIFADLQKQLEIFGEHGNLPAKQLEMFSDKLGISVEELNKYIKGLQGATEKTKQAVDENIKEIQRGHRIKLPDPVPAEPVVKPVVSTSGDVNPLDIREGVRRSGSQRTITIDKAGEIVIGDIPIEDKLASAMKRDQIPTEHQTGQIDLENPLQHLHKSLSDIEKIDTKSIGFRFEEFDGKMKSLSEKTDDASKMLIPSVNNIAMETESLGQITGKITDQTSILHDKIGELPDDVNKLIEVNKGFTEQAEKTKEVLKKISDIAVSQSPVGDEPISATGQPSIYKDTTPDVASDTMMLIQDAGLQVVSSFKGIEDAIWSGMSGGLPGALTSFGLSLLQETKGFQRLQVMWDKLFSKLVDAIEPVITVLANVLEPIFTSLGVVLKELQPLFMLLGNVLKYTLLPVVKAISTVISFVAKAFGWLIDGIKKILSWVGINIKTKEEVETEKQPRPQRVGGFTSREGREVVDIGRPTSDTGKVRRGTLTPEEIEKSETERRERAGVDSSTSSSSIQISKITGPTRDILVDLLRPLKQLDNVFPKMMMTFQEGNNILKMLNTSFTAMLSELRNIREVLTPGFRPPNQSAVPGSPSERSGFSLRQQDFQNTSTFSGNNNTSSQDTTQPIIVQEFNLNVEQIQDIDINEINRQLNQLLQLDRRGARECICKFNLIHFSICSRIQDNQHYFG